jgi:hypothetical protein
VTELVDPTEIEQIVGAKRHRVQHLARAVSAEETLYILHSHECKDSGVDLRECPYSIALDLGIDLHRWWRDREDQTVALAIMSGRLVPLVPDGAAVLVEEKT